MNCNNCPDPIYDNCVFYTGPDINELGIKSGDPLSLVEEVLLDGLKSVSKGEGIFIPNIIIDNTTLEELIDGDYSISNIIQALTIFSENIKTEVDDLSAIVNKPISVNAPCLVLSPSATKDDVLKATAEKVCAINTVVNSISSDYVKATEICDIIKTCVEEASSNPTNPIVLVQENTKMPKYCPIPYTGPMSVFDSTGKGISSLGYEKVYLCNGNNGTDDLRGRSLIGANTNVSGGSLDSAVDPALSINAGYSFAVKTKKGAYTHVLAAAENATHSHAVNDPGHFHYLSASGSSSTLTSNNYLLSFKEGIHNNNYQFHGTSGFPSLGRSSSSQTGITLGSSGNSTPHNNTQPSFGVNYIIYLP